MKAIQKRLQTIADQSDKFALTHIFQGLFKNTVLSVGTVTTSAAATLATAADIVALIDGVLVDKATGSTFAMTGPTIANSGSATQTWLLVMDNAGNLTTLAGTPAATLGATTLALVADTAPRLQPVAVITLVNGSVGSFVPGTTLCNVANLTWAFYPIVGSLWPVQTF